MNKLCDFTKKFPLIFAILFTVLVPVAYKLVCKAFPGTDVWSSAVPEIIGVAIAVVVVLIFVKPHPFNFSSAGAKFGFKKSIYLVLVGSVAVSLFSSLGLLAKGSFDPISFDSFIVTIIGCIFLVAAIGVFEELIYRVILFGGLIAKMGKSTKGIIWAAIISSLIFGFVHVMDVLFQGNPITPLMIGQIAGKTLQTAIFGFLLCGIYLKTRNFFVIAVIHAVYDFFAVSPQFFTSASSGYVSADNPALIFFYFGISIILIPAIISAVRMLKSIKTPEYGVLLSKEYLPRDPQETKK